MSNFPAITGRQLIKSLNKLGFEKVRSKGSHCFLRHPDGRCTVIPVHTGETIGRGLLSRIMRECEMTLEDLKKIF